MSQSRKLITSLIPLAAVCMTAMPASFAGESEATFEEALAATKPIFNARLRYEGVDQDGLPETASALTYRFRAGLETGAYKDTKFLIEFDHVEDIVDDFNSTTNGMIGYPVVADPNVTELNRLQFTNTSLPDTKVTIGRQRINLDDQRFVGGVAWRQNEQTFDAIRIENTSFGDLKIDFSYINRINRIFGDESPIGEWDGDTFLLNVSKPTPIGKVTGFAYLIDADNAGGRFSNQTIGARLQGKQDVGPGKFGYLASFANQTDYGSSNLDYNADFYTLEGSYTVDKFTGALGIEVLGGDDQQGFQTPLATLHKFQGFADKFLGTPASGVEDIYAKGVYKAGDVGFLKGLALTGIYHDYSADVGGSDYGSEINLVAAAKIEKVKVLLKFADYNSDGFATDTQKFWLQFDFAL